MTYPTATSARGRRVSRHRLVQRSIGLAFVGATVLLPALPARAQGHSSVEFDYNTAFADFTDCPVPGPTGFTETGDCLATAINAVKATGEAAGHESRSATVYVTLFAVHYGPDVPGGFTFAPIADGSAAGRIEAKNLQSATVAATVTLSDGTAVTMRTKFSGTGPTSVQTGTFTGTVPECPSGSANMAYRFADREASVTGQVTAHGIVESPTSVVAAPQLQQEHDEGTCTS